MVTNDNGYYVMYKDAQKLWRWTFFAKNHEAIAVSSESYVNQTDCRHGIDLIAASKGCVVHIR